jgi:predicted site-specific integrase-resolvase
MVKLNTREAATELGVCVRTLHGWVAEGSIPRPEAMRVGKNTIFLFSESDLRRARAHQAKLHRKGWPANVQTPGQAAQ